ncbi:MAG: TIGR03960 family B12-binding radical SAM protein [Endomicrobiia bacterium]|nr:TIGR03960 family B12-binding radical SAM protein [Endomicrobiia bacterium]
MKDQEKILSSVRRPSRYIGGEWNSYSSDSSARLRVSSSGPENKNPSATICLCYPDLYEIGTSSSGIEILYSVVNEDPRFAAQRCFAPDADMAEALASRGEKLFSLETKTPLREFDAVGFTLQHELCATNLLYMLESAGIGIFASRRADVFPVILGGGPLTMNPEPFADFFDAFVIGDGEEAIVEIMERIAAAKSSRASKRELLESLAGVDGVYVPSLYEPRFDGEGGIFTGLHKLSDAVEDTVVRRVFDIASRPPAATPVVPSASSVHSRLSVEIARGCPHNCSFCQAAVYYRPLRVREPAVILEAVKRGLKNTGYDEVSFASLSSGDYRGIAGLIEETIKSNSFYPLTVALPSLHCDKFDREVASALAKSASRPSVTLAPEAGTERLRASIGKRLSDDAIVSAARAAYDSGWKQIKLYFMYGLPGETDEDIEGVAALVKRIRSELRGIGVKVSMSPFVPKALTAFEREKFDGIAELSRKKDKLRGLLGGAFKSHDIEASFTESLLARGDRRMSKVIARAYALGAKFDQWREHFRFDLWMKAFADEGINPTEYSGRIGPATALPWAHISAVFAPATAWRSDMSQVLPSAAPEIRPIPGAFVPAPALNPVRFRIRLERRGLARFISHNDQIEIFRRAARRARLRIKYSSGFHPQPKIAFGPAVAVGHESRAEYMEAEFLGYAPPQETAERLGVCLPDGYSVLSVRQIPTAFASLEALCGAAQYTVFFEEIPAFAHEALKNFNDSSEVIVEVASKPRDIKKIVRDIELSGQHHLHKQSALRMTLNILPSGNLKPEKIASHIFGVPSETLLVRRESFYAVKRDGSIIEI